MLPNMPRERDVNDDDDDIVISFQVIRIVKMYVDARRENMRKSLPLEYYCCRRISGLMLAREDFMPSTHVR